MGLSGLGYAGFGAAELDDWREFGTTLVGLQAVERGNSLLAFRMDNRKQRIVIDRAAPEGSRFFGWEVTDAAALDELAARLEQAGVAVTAEPQALADARHVRGLISFHDPEGNRLEAFYGAEIDATPFKPGRAISGFRTGPLGLGHAVLTVERIDPMLAFYVDVLGFGLSDYILKPFRAYFFHVNPRHHSLALIETGKSGMHHLMVEMFSLDDVGQAYDVALSQPDRIGTSLGRHTNDFMTSFYARTPSSFMIECGWGGREIDPATWQPYEMQDGPSLWGHERVWLPAEGPRARARDADARRRPRPPRAGAGDGRQFQAHVRHLSVVGRDPQRNGLTIVSRIPVTDNTPVRSLRADRGPSAPSRAAAAHARLAPGCSSPSCPRRRPPPFGGSLFHRHRRRRPIKPQHGIDGLADFAHRVLAVLGEIESPAGAFSMASA